MLVYIMEHLALAKIKLLLLHVTLCAYSLHYNITGCKISALGSQLVPAPKWTKSANRENVFLSKYISYGL